MKQKSTTVHPMVLFCFYPRSPSLPASQNQISTNNNACAHDTVEKSTICTVNSGEICHLFSFAAILTVWSLINRINYAQLCGH
ncbi:hypothetical protein TH30_21305 [Thalassospira profundimaris]|uniref:Uncharacterized protein n=1 Tax=Thalassospira profundimaris TaxID=502049 RepID=A0A367WKJ3_9PROT|nr:hypothetical protein TH30_21305 [Thalassospira profundimaris]